jgi:hypothetical protein
VVPNDRRPLRITEVLAMKSIRRLTAAALAAATAAVLAWGPTAILAGISFNALD